jgi:hypothetical protein
MKVVSLYYPEQFIFLASIVICLLHKLFIDSAIVGDTQHKNKKPINATT